MNDTLFQKCLDRRNEDPTFQARLHGPAIAGLAMMLWRSWHDKNGNRLQIQNASGRSSQRVVIEELNNLTGDFCRSALFYSAEAKKRLREANVTTMRDKKVAKQLGLLLVENNGPKKLNSITNLGLCHEHGVSNGQLWLSIDEMLEGATCYEDVLKRMEKYFMSCFTAVITLEEDKKVTAVGLTGKMPTNHRMLQDHPAARYKIAGIYDDLEYNEDYWLPL
jgi:hypothetical protein